MPDTRSPGPDDEPHLVWSEVADMMTISPGIQTVDDLITALERFRDDPPEPYPPRRPTFG